MHSIVCLLVVFIVRFFSLIIYPFCNFRFSFSSKWYTNTQCLSWEPDGIVYFSNFIDLVVLVNFAYYNLSIIFMKIEVSFE